MSEQLRELEPLREEPSELENIHSFNELFRFLLLQSDGIPSSLGTIPSRDLVDKITDIRANIREGASYNELLAQIPNN
jgi:hypothetical protein